MIALVLEFLGTWVLAALLLAGGIGAWNLVAAWRVRVRLARSAGRPVWRIVR